MDSVFPLLLIVLVFLVLIVLPSRQRKKVAARAKLLQDSLSVGAPVMLTSGIHGTVAGLGDGTVQVEIAPGTVITVVRAAIMEVRTPAGVISVVDDEIDGDLDDDDRSDDDDRVAGADDRLAGDPPTLGRDGEPTDRSR